MVNPTVNEVQDLSLNGALEGPPLTLLPMDKQGPGSMDPPLERLISRSARKIHGQYSWDGIRTPVKASIPSM